MNDDALPHLSCHVREGLNMRISHVSAVKNEEQWLPVMLESWQVAAGDSDAEILIVNDHSTDATEAVARDFAAVDPRIRVFSSEASQRVPGKVAAFNLGMEHVTGDFIGLMGGDDMFPPDAMNLWRRAIDARPPNAQTVAFGRLKTMSNDPKADGLVIPRRPVGNRSGGTSLFSRATAQRIFPIPEILPSEDTWTRQLLSMSSDIVEVPEVVLWYRIHEGNSNPRHQNFSSMTESIHRRLHANDLLLADPRIRLTSEQRMRLEAAVELESRRYAGNLLGVLTFRQTTTRNRLRTAAMTTPRLWSLRQRLFDRFSGW